MQTDTEPDCGLVSLTIPQNAELASVLETRTAKRLWQRGARLYLMGDGTTNVLALKRPPGAFCRSVSLHVMQPERHA
jgi:hypothetical protein